VLGPRSDRSPRLQQAGPSQQVRPPSWNGVALGQRGISRRPADRLAVRSCSARPSKNFLNRKRLAGGFLRSWKQKKKIKKKKKNKQKKKKKKKYADRYGQPTKENCRRRRTSRSIRRGLPSPSFARCRRGTVAERAPKGRERACRAGARQKPTRVAGRRIIG